MRKATLHVTYDGKIISEDVSRHLIEFSFTDRAHGKQDDLSIGLEDRGKLWRGAWFPQKGAKVSASIDVQDWMHPGDNRSLKCGTFSIDQIEVVGPPSTVTIGAVSVSIDCALREELHTRAWKSTSLRSIAASVAHAAGMQLFYDARLNPRWGRVDQREESNAALVERLCRAAALNCKVSDGKLVIFSQADYDTLPPAATIKPDDAGLVSYSMETKTNEIYRGCTCTYWNAKLQRLVHHTYYPKHAPRSGRMLKLNNRYETKAQADAAAKAALRNSNGQEFTGNIRFMGRPDLAAGQNILLSGFGGMDGKYAIAEARHVYSNTGGYTTELNLRVTLEED